MSNTINEDIFDIGRLTHLQVSRRIERCPAVIVPLGGCEPFGGAGELWTESECVLEISRELSRRTQVLMAPMIPFGCSTPFISFSGAVGVKPRTFVNMLCEILHGYVFQGISRIFLVSAAPFNREPAGEVLRRMGVKYPGIKTLFFDVNTILRDDKGVDFDRDDGLMLSILSYIRQKSANNDMSCRGGNLPPAVNDNTSPAVDVINAKPIDAVQYKTWKRRGRDPQKFKAICPDGLLLSPNNNDITAARGKEHFDAIITIIKEKITTV